jgi:hypothetical protein
MFNLNSAQAVIVEEETRGWAVLHANHWIARMGIQEKLDVRSA